MQTKEICEDCGKLFVAGPDAYLCPECRKKRLSEYAKRRKRLRKTCTVTFATNRINNRPLYPAGGNSNYCLVLARQGYLLIFLGFRRWG